MYTVKQVAERLNLSLSSVYELVASNRLRALRLGTRGGAIRIRSEDLSACLSQALDRLLLVGAALGKLDLATAQITRPPAGLAEKPRFCRARHC